MTVFVDTSFHIATLVKNDQWSERARRAALEPVRLVTSSLVISETAAFLQARGFLSAAMTFLREMRGSGRVQLVHVDAALQNEGWDLFYRWASIGASPVDCTSFAIMERFGIRTAYTFDAHFRTAGFAILA